MTAVLPGISRWSGRVALVTGASSGIGEAVSKALVQHGLKVIACARNITKIDANIEECRKLGYKGQLHSFKCDLQNETEIIQMFSWIEANHGGVDVCINSAGLGNTHPLLECTAAEMRQILDVNVIALVLCTKEAVKSMKNRGVEDGHIFNLNSMSGHRLTIGAFNFYSASKFAVTAITEGFRRELVDAGTRIRVTQISPGLVRTEFLSRAFNSEDIAETIFQRCPEAMKPQDIADIIVFTLSAPPYLQVHDILLRPTGDKF